VTEFTPDLLDLCREAARESSIRPTASGHYYMYLSREAVAFLVMVRAKEDWKARHRAVRIARRWVYNVLAE
jgi:hypothetical protein